MKNEIENKIYQILKCLDGANNLSSGLFTGATGVSMLYFMSNRLLNNPKGADKGVALIEEVFEEIGKEKNPIPTFCIGVAGLGWFLEYAVSQNLVDIDLNETLEDIDSLLSKDLKLCLKYNNWDFLHGGIGIGIYFLKRYAHNQQEGPIKDIIDFLQLKGERNENGEIKWMSVIDFKVKKEGYNISLSHGMSSIVAFLIKVHAQNLFMEETTNLLNGAINYILAQEIDIHKYGSFFPSYSIESEKELQGSRIAWCYGDLTIATVLWQAGISMKNDNWINKALEILLYTAENRRDLQKNFVADAGLCHGTAGIGHIFYRMWWNTRMPEFKQAADYWFQETLKMSQFPDGLAGFKSWHSFEYGGWVNEYGMLEGISGIGMAMLSYVTETEPNWDECFLLS